LLDPILRLKPREPQDTVAAVDALDQLGIE
jgi:hypothetical protein